MPYVEKAGRDALNEDIQSLAWKLSGVGELNYTITSLVHAWLARERVCYASLNAAIGVLECSKQELYRRVVAPYEDQKIKANGDLPPVEEGR